MPPGGEGRARAYFGDIIGMLEDVKPEPLGGRGGCWFHAGGAILHLGVEKEFAPQLKAHPAFCVLHLDALAERLGKAGFPVVWDEALQDKRRFYSADPFGNRIEFIRDGDGFGQGPVPKG